MIYEIKTPKGWQDISSTFAEDDGEFFSAVRRISDADKVRQMYTGHIQIKHGKHNFCVRYKRVAKFSRLYA